MLLVGDRQYSAIRRKKNQSLATGHHSVYCVYGTNHSSPIGGLFLFGVIMAKRQVFNIVELEKVFRIVGGKLERLSKIRKPYKWKVIENKANQSQGYCQVDFNGRKCMYHVILWILFHKENIPENLKIDHINGNKIDNRLENLRLVTQRENLQNRSEHRKGKLAGVSYCKKIDKKYRAQISINNKDVYLGYYQTDKEANKAYEKACKHLEEYVDNESFRAIVNT